MSGIKGNNIPKGIVLVCGVVVTLAYFFNINAISVASDTLQVWTVIIAGFAVGLGVVNMVRIHSDHMLKKKEGQWLYSIVFMFFFALQALTGIIDLKNLANPLYVWTYTNVFGPLAAAMYAILGFFIVSAAYRALRAKTLESAVILVTGIIVMLKNAPIGAVIWSGFPGLGAWILEVPAAAGNRAVLIGTGIGTILLGIRILLGYERGHIGGGN